MNCAGQCLQTLAGLHQHGELADHLPRVGRDDSGAQNLVGTLPDVNPGKPFVLTVQNRAVHFLQLVREGFHLPALGLGVGFVEADMGDLRLGIGAPGDQQGIRAGIGEAERVRKQRVLDYDLGHGIGRMRKLEREADIAGCIDSRVGRLQPMIHLHSGPSVLDADFFEAETFNVRGPADADEDLIHH